MTHHADEMRACAAKLRDRLVGIRRAIHHQPELGLQTPLTQARVCEELERIGVPSPALGRACSSVVAEIVGEAGPGERCVALRADMDALPLRERSQVSFASATDGRMHACGHDAHVAMLLGAAELLWQRRCEFAGRVRLLFQPGEEGYGGARVMIGEGALDGVTAAFALHVDSSLRAHTVALRTGAMLAAFDDFRVVFRGAGGHASMPHNTRDPIPAIGPFVDGLSHVTARETDPDDRAVLSVTIVRAGSADNVVPSEALCAGTIRTLSPAARERARERLRRVAQGVAASRGLDVDVDVHEGYPPTVNAPAAVGIVEESAASLALRVHAMPSPIMGAEDFSYVLERVPGAMAFLGARTEPGGPLHSDVMNIDEDVLATGAALHATVALNALRDRSAPPDS
jgi:hippurate hydrolase